MWKHRPFPGRQKPRGLAAKIWDLYENSTILTRFCSAQPKIWDFNQEIPLLLTGFLAAQRKIWDFNQEIPLFLTNLLATQRKIWDFPCHCDTFSSLTLNILRFQRGNTVLMRKIWDFNEEVPYFDGPCSRAAKILRFEQGNFRVQPGNSTILMHFLATLRNLSIITLENVKPRVSSDRIWHEETWYFPF